MLSSPPACKGDLCMRRINVQSKRWLRKNKKIEDNVTLSQAAQEKARTIFVKGWTWVEAEAMHRYWESLCFCFGVPGTLGIPQLVVDWVKTVEHHGTLLKTVQHVR